MGVILSFFINFFKQHPFIAIFLILLAIIIILGIIALIVFLGTLYSASL